MLGTLMLATIALFFFCCTIYLVYRTSHLESQKAIAIEKLIDKVDENKLLRRQALATLFRETFCYENKVAEDHAKEALKAENELLCRIIDLYVGNNIFAIMELDELIMACQAPYIEKIRLLKPAKGEQQLSPQARAAVAVLEEKTEKLEKDFEFSMYTLNQVFNEYTALYHIDRGKEGDLTLEEINTLMGIEEMPDDPAESETDGEDSSSTENQEDK